MGVTLVNGVAGYNVNGKFGQSLNSGTGSISPYALPANKVWSVDFWAKCTTVPSGLKVILTIENAWIGISDGVLTMNTHAGDTSTGINICDGNWHYISASNNGTVNSKISVDGVTSTRAPSTYYIDSGAAALILRGHPAGLNFPGEIDELAIWSIIKDPTVIPVGPYSGSEPGLIELFHLNGNLDNSQGAVVVDEDPTISIDTPQTSYVTGESFNITATVADDFGVVLVEFFDGATKLGEIDSPPYIFPINSVAEGVHNYTGVATDTVGQTATSAIRAITAATGALTVDANHANIKYSPQNWKLTGTTMQSCNPGAYFRTRFKGTLIRLYFDVTGNNTANDPQMMYRIDRGAWIDFTVAPSVLLEMRPSSIGQSSHTLEVVIKATTSGSDIVTFKGIQLDTNKTIYNPGVLSKTAIVFGDSIAAGSYARKSTEGLNLLDSHDGGYAWPFLMRELLGMEIGVIGFPGQSTTDWTGTWNKILMTTATRTFLPEPDYMFDAYGANDAITSIPNNTTVANRIIVYNGLFVACPNAKLIQVPLFHSGYTIAQTTTMDNAKAGCSDPSRVYKLNHGITFYEAPDSVHLEGQSQEIDAAYPIANAARTLIDSFNAGSGEPVEVEVIPDVTVTANVPKAFLSPVTKTFVQLGIDGTKVRSIIKIGTPYESYVPASSINQITGLTQGQSYHVNPIANFTIS